MTSSSIVETFSLITQWGKDRNIIGEGKSKDQFPKLAEEYSEIIEGLAKTNLDEVKDGVGDTAVVLTMICGIENLEIDSAPLESFTGRPMDAIEALKHAALAFGTMGTSIAKNDKQKLTSGINALFEVLPHFAATAGFSFGECLEHSYNVIKTRTGILFDGVFIKSDDERYEAAVAEVERRRLNTDDPTQAEETLIENIYKWALVVPDQDALDAIPLSDQNYADVIVVGDTLFKLKNAERPVEDHAV